MGVDTSPRVQVERRHTEGWLPWDSWAARAAPYVLPGGAAGEAGVVGTLLGQLRQTVISLCERKTTLANVLRAAEELRAFLRTERPQGH